MLLNYNLSLSPPLSLHNLFIYSSSLAAMTNLAFIVNKIIIIVVILNKELKGFYCWFKVLKCFSHTW